MLKNKKVLSGLGFGFVGLLAGQASAQQFTELLREGDMLNGEIISNVQNVDINNAGDWLIELNTDGVDDQYMLHNGNIIWQENTDMGFVAPAGKVAHSYIDVMDINNNGDIMFITPLRDIGTTSQTNFLLVHNGVTLIETGTTMVPASLGLPAGTFYSGVSEAWQNDNGNLLVVASVALAGTGNTAIMLRIDVDGTSTITSTTKVAMVGETLTGPTHITPIQGFSTSKGRQVINNNGDYLWYVDDVHSPGGDTLSDSNIYMNNTVMWNEADPFPTDPADVFDHFSTAEMDLNDNGDWVFSGFDRGPSADDSWIFKSIGGTLTTIAHEGDPVNPAWGVGAGWNVAGFGFGGLVPMSNNGDVLWFLDWNDPDTTIDTALMFNDQPMMVEGVTMFGALVLEDAPNSDSEIAMSDDGSLAIVEIVLDDTTDLDVVYIMEIESPIGTAYCDPAELNSTGSPAVLGAVGNTMAAANLVTLNASGMPTGEFGYFLNGTGNMITMNPAGSAGNLCVSTNIGRYNELAQIFNTGMTGEGSLSLDLMDTPSAGGPVVISAGQTYYFQCWYRDTPNTTSNFTNGVCITFN